MKAREYSEQQTFKGLKRRNFVQAGSALLGSGVLLYQPVSAQPGRTTEPLAKTHTAPGSTPFVPPPTLTDHLRGLFAEAQIELGRVTLNLPALAENGNSVALGISAAPDTNNVPPKKLYLLAEKNPLPDIARFTTDERLTGALDIETRIRLSDSQRILCIAEYADNTLFAGEASIIVTLAACIDLPT